MDDLISRQAAIDEIRKCRFVVDAIEKIRRLPPAQPEQLYKINDLVEGTIDHFDKDDAMDLLYAIKGVLKNG